MDYKITIHKDADGENDGVRVQAMDEDFLISLNDRYGGEEVTLKKAAKDSRLPDSPMVLIVGMLALEINAALKEAGGTPMSDWYWSKTQAEIVFGDDTEGWLIFEGHWGYLNHNYDFFLCTAKVREFTDLRKEDEK